MIWIVIIQGGLWTLLGILLSLSAWAVFDALCGYDSRAPMVTFALGVLLSVAVGCYVPVNGLGPNYGTGEVTGTVSGLGTFGVFVKSNEGVLLSGSDVGGAVSTEFTVLNPDFLSTLRAAQASKQRVRLTLKKWILSPYYMGSSAEVTGVHVEASK